LIDRSLTEVRIAAGSTAQRQLVSLKNFIEDVCLPASLEARQHECTLNVPPVDSALAVYADQHLLAAALSNVLQNAFKFTKYQSAVTLRAHAPADRVLIEVGDHCGGLAPGDIEKMFLPFAQTGTNLTGLGLGLTLSRRAVEANDGTLSARDIPGSGCVFTISLPRRTLPMAGGWRLPGPP
jgi:signal transduction histidine kinase